MTYSIDCDERDVVEPDEQCDAEFELAIPPNTMLVWSLVREQLAARGWLYRQGEHGPKFICPLHHARLRPV